jgi:hypothetical protein
VSYDTDDLVHRLRQYIGNSFITRETSEAANMIEQQAARIAELEAEKESMRPVLKWFNDQVWFGQDRIAELQKDATRYRWMRCRAVMIDSSDEVVLTITLFKNKGPTGEFLDDQIDGMIAAEKKAL